MFHVQLLPRTQGFADRRLFQWIGVDPWFSGSATAAAPDQPSATPIPKGFKVTASDDGTLEITISKWVHDRLQAISDNIPACPLKRRRELVSTCTRRRIYKYVNDVGEDTQLVDQFKGLSSDVASAVGGDGYEAELVAADQALTFGEVEPVRNILQGVGATSQLAGATPNQMGVFAFIMSSTLSATGALIGGHLAPMPWKLPTKKPEAVAMDEIKASPPGKKKKTCPKDGKEKVSSPLEVRILRHP